MYLGLSALDFPFCFVAVRLLGVERIGHWEHVAVSSVKDVFKSVWPQAESGSVPAEGDGALVKAEQEEEEGSMEEASMSHVTLFSTFRFVFCVLRGAMANSLRY